MHSKYTAKGRNEINKFVKSVNELYILLNSSQIKKIEIIHNVIHMITKPFHVTIYTHKLYKPVQLNKQIGKIT